jgi:hypothetical protein
MGRFSEFTNDYAPMAGGDRLRSRSIWKGTPAPPSTPSGTITPPAAPVGPFTERNGNYASAYGMEVRNSGGGTYTKQYIHRYTDYGFLNMQYYPPGPAGTGITTVEDMIVEDITRSVPRSSDGTAEAGFWFGNTTSARRLISRRCAWMGMWTGSQCDNSVIEDFQLLEQPYVGLYIEHVTHDCVFRRFKIESSGTGINIEWWYGGAGSYNLTFEDGDIYCPAGGYPLAGVFADAGTYGLTFRRCRFWGPGRAIWLPNNMVQNVPAVIQDCVFEQSGPNVSYHSNAIG